MLKLRGSIKIEHSLATRGANKLWQLLHTEPFVPALGAQTGNQAVQMVKAGLKAIYLSGTYIHTFILQKNKFQFGEHKLHDIHNVCDVM